MKKQLNTNSYQQLGIKKKIEKVEDYIKKQNLESQQKQTNNMQIQISSQIGGVDQILQGSKQQRHNSNSSQYVKGLKSGIIYYNGQNQDSISNNQNGLVQDHQNQYRCNTLPDSTPLTETTYKNKISRSPSKSGSKIKLQSAQLETIQKQFNKLLEKENKNTTKTKNSHSCNKRFQLQQKESSSNLSCNDNVTQQSSTKTTSNQKRQRNITQLSINFSNNSNSNANNKVNGSQGSMTRINRSLTPNSMKNNLSFHETKNNANQNLLQLLSGNQTTANISQKHYELQTKLGHQSGQSGQKQSGKQLKTNNYSDILSQQNKQSCQKQVKCFQNTDQVNNISTTSLIQRNPQMIDEYHIKDKQLNKILQQLLQSKMKQQISKEQNQCSDGLKCLENNNSYTSAQFQTKPNTLPSQKENQDLKNNKLQQSQELNIYYTNANDIIDNSDQYFTQNIMNQDIEYNQYNQRNNNNLNGKSSQINQIQQDNHILLQQSLQNYIQGNNIQNNDILQEQLKIEDQFQQRYQQYKEKFNSNQMQKVNNQKPNFNENIQIQEQQQKVIESSTMLENIQDSIKSSKAKNKCDFIDKVNESNISEKILKEKEMNQNISLPQNASNVFNQSNHELKQLLIPDESNKKQNHHHQLISIQQSMSPMTIHTDIDHMQLLSNGEIENMIKFQQNNQFPDNNSIICQDMMNDMPNDMHQEIMIIYEQKIKEITDKFSQTDILLRQNLVKLKKENSQLLNRVQEQQDEISRYKKLREMETKLVKKLENEIKLEKQKYQKLHQQKSNVQSNEVDNNQQLIDELNQRINVLQQEKDCLEYLLKDALLKTEMLKAKENSLLKQASLSNNLNQSTSSFQGGNQTTNNFNQVNNNVQNNSCQSSSNNPVQSVQYMNLLSLDNSLNQTQNHESSSDQLHLLQQQQFKNQQQQFQQLQQQIEDHPSHNQNYFNGINEKVKRNKQQCQEEQFGENNIQQSSNQPNLQNQQKMIIQNQYPMNTEEYYQATQMLKQQEIQYKLKHYQANNNYKEDQQSSERNNVNYQNSYYDNMENNSNYHSNYAQKQNGLNQINNNQYQLYEENQGSEMKNGSQMTRSSQQNQLMQTEDYYYSENDQTEEYDQQDPMKQNPQLLLQINQNDNDANNILNYEFSNTNNYESNLLMMQQNYYQDIKNHDQLNGQQMNDIRPGSNSSGNITTYNNNHEHEILICERNDKSANKSYLINNSQVIIEEASSAVNTTQNNLSNNNYNAKHKPSYNSGSSGFIDENDVINANNTQFNKQGYLDNNGSKIFIQNERIFKQDNKEQDEEIEAEFKDISESNRRNQQRQNNTQSNPNQNEKIFEDQISVDGQINIELPNDICLNDKNAIKQNINKDSSQQINQSIQDNTQKDNDQETKMNYNNTKNIYLQKYYASQNGNQSSGISPQSQGASQNQ